MLLARVPRDDKVLGNLQNRQRSQPQKVKLHQANRFHIVFVKLADSRVAAGLLVQRAKVGEFARRNQHAAGMHANVARQAFELAGQFQQGLDVVFFGFALSENRFSF